MTPLCYFCGIGKGTHVRADFLDHDPRRTGTDGRAWCCERPSCRERLLDRWRGKSGERRVAVRRQAA